MVPDAMPEKRCRIHGCISPSYKRGLCGGHYSEYRAKKEKYEHNQTLERKRSYVYAAITLELDQERVKFGRTNNPKKRISTLQVGSPVKIGLGAYVEGDQDLERLVHAACTDERLHGEWFVLSGTAEKIFNLMRGQDIQGLDDLLDLNKYAILKKQELA